MALPPVAPAALPPMRTVSQINNQMHNPGCAPGYPSVSMYAEGVTPYKMHKHPPPEEGNQPRPRHTPHWFVPHHCDHSAAAGEGLPSGRAPPTRTAGRRCQPSHPAWVLASSPPPNEAARPPLAAPRPAGSTTGGTSALRDPRPPRGLVATLRMQRCSTLCVNRVDPAAGRRQPGSPHQNTSKGAWGYGRLPPVMASHRVNTSHHQQGVEQR